VRIFRFLCAAIVASSLSCVGRADTKPATDRPVAELSASDAIILGTVEGVTEYLPISSTGHLIIANHAMKLDSDLTLRGRDDSPLWYKKPSARHAQGEPLTLKLAADTYTVVIQFGAIAAVALLYWRRLLAMANGLLGRNPEGLRLLRNILLAFFPAALIGLALHDWIDEHLFSIPAVIAAQVGGAILIFLAEAYRKRRDRIRSVESSKESFDLSARQSVTIGLLQCVALWPGTSRSMMTMLGGYLAGLTPKRSAEFSFLLGLVTLTAATVFKSYKSGAAMIAVFGWPHVILGCVVAAVTAAIAVKFLVGWLSRHGMIVFAYYRLALAGVLLVLMRM
jgi:undecaprenyl-diphosphatase